MKLRPAELADVDAIAQIIGNWFTTTPYLPRLHTAEEDRGFVGRMIEGQDVVVAEADGAVLGFIAREGAEIDHLHVAEAARNQGIGSVLLNEMKKRSDVLELWCFQQNAGARRFYERQGFAPNRFTDGQDNEEKLPDVRYVWRSET